MENPDVVRMARNGEIGQAVWKAWQQAYARGAWEGQQAKP
jgi:hypothetical protein